jgi:hypothetical protein
MARCKVPCTLYLHGKVWYYRTYSQEGQISHYGYPQQLDPVRDAGIFNFGVSSERFTGRVYLCTSFVIVALIFIQHTRAGISD